MNDEIRNVSIALPDIAQTIEDKLKKAAGRKVIFALVVFTEGRIQYISGGDREGVKNGLKTLISWWEDENTVDIPAHRLDS